MTENSDPTILSWSVKESLLQYIRALGEISYVSGLVELGDELVWPLASDHHDADGVRIAEFGGAIHLRAHDGLLDIVIADPEVRVNETQGQLSVRTALDAPERVVIATLDGIESSASVLRAEVQVTAAGSAVFGANYPSGTRLSPLTIGSDRN